MKVTTVCRGCKMHFISENIVGGQTEVGCPVCSSSNTIESRYTLTCPNCKHYLHDIEHFEIKCLNPESPKFQDDLSFNDSCNEIKFKEVKW
jgi:hypothetical protein